MPLSLATSEPVLHQKINALGIAVDCFLFEDHHLRQIKAGRNSDAHFAEGMLGLGKKLGGMEQGLGRNAADVQASAAVGGALFNDGHLHAKLGGANGADIAARAGADYGEIKLFSHDGFLKISNAPAT
jgi:hypothetical protein